MLFINIFYDDKIHFTQVFILEKKYTAKNQGFVSATDGHIVNKLQFPGAPPHEM